MSSIFYRGQFDDYRISDLKSALGSVRKLGSFSKNASLDDSYQITVFSIS